MRFIFFLMAGLAMSCGNSTKPNPAANTTKPTPVPAYTSEIVKTYPHDPAAFTQGLIYLNGFLYEGTGGKDGDNFYSSLRKVELDTGRVLQKYDLPREYFGEGITVLNDKVYQLTWRERTAFVYNLADFTLLREFRYSGEGWGLTDDGKELYMSDGTHVLRVVDPETFQTTRTIVVLDERGQPIMELNELEWVKGELWANVWQSGWIMRIDPASGKLLGRIDLNQMTKDEKQANQNADVLNGIAHDESSDRLFVTGKKWRRLFEIKVVPKQ
ncbi:MAG: glutaminyl-peptide cyclotransferase [Blastocatellia bacterium]